MSLTIWATRIIPLPGEEEALEQRLGNLSETLIQSVSSDCRQYLKNNLKSSASMSRQSGRILLSKILKRCEDLNFISPKITPLIDYLRSAVSKLPSQGMIGGGHFDLLKGVVSFIANKEMLEELCNGSISADQLFGSSMPVQTPQEPELDFGLTQAQVQPEDVAIATPSEEEAVSEVSTVQPVQPRQQNLQALLFGDDEDVDVVSPEPNSISESDESGDSGMLPEAPETIDINEPVVETQVQAVTPVAVQSKSGPRVLSPSVPYPDFDNL